MTADDLDEVSLLHLLFLVRGHGSINTLFSIENGAQENMVDGGAGQAAVADASTALGWLLPTATSTLRALAFSATGMVRVSTPFS